LVPDLVSTRRGGLVLRGVAAMDAGALGACGM